MTPSPCPLPTQLLHSSALPYIYFSSDTYRANYNKFARAKLALVPTASLSSSVVSQKEESSLVDRNGISLAGAHNELPIKGEDLESLEMDKKARRLQVQNFLEEIRALPCKDGTNLLNIFEKDKRIWSISEFNDLLLASIIADEPVLAFKLFFNLSSYRLEPDSETFSIIIRCCCKKNEIDEAERILHHMLENGFNPNIAAFTTLINSFCKRGKLQKSFQLFGIMERIGCRPTVQMYNCLLKGLCYVGRVEDAFELLVDVKKSSLKPDIYTYTAVMDGFCKVGRSDEAMELLNEALQMGLTPTVVTFNTLFQGYNKEGRPMEGIGVLKQMKLVNCLPDNVSYSTLLHGLLIWREIQAAAQVYKEMVGNGFEVDDRLMNNLLRGICREFLKENVLVEDAYKVFEKMQTRVSAIDHSTYDLLIQALCKLKKVDDALVNLQQMIELGYIPRLTTINSVIRTLCAEEKVDKAFSVLILMYENQKMPTRIAYDHLIHELNRQRRLLGACNVYGAALIRGVVPHRKPQ